MEPVPGSFDLESHAVEAVGRVNLLALIAAGYDGPYADEIRTAVERATRVSLLFQDPSGQCPMNGRTGDHVFNDVLYALAFEIMAERAHTQGDARLAAQYRHAAMLSFQSIGRWRRTDPDWEGSFYITKNHFDPAERVGYQPASNWGNYNGAVMMHLAEAWLARKSPIPEQPAPAEIGGYALAADWGFGSVFANAGGMQLAANLRGDTIPRYDTYWSPLGVVRLGRVGWDTRPGPSDGVRDTASKRGVTFAPTWKGSGGAWVRLADVAESYRGQFDVVFCHPLLVRCRIQYQPIAEGGGLRFQHEFTLTPDGILARLTASGAGEFGVTLPLVEDDGKPLETAVGDRVASTRYPGAADQQNFIALDPEARFDRTEPPLRSPYGWLRRVRLTGNVFVYPRGAGDPEAETVRAGFRRTRTGLYSPLGRVEGNLYIGCNSRAAG
ncbi:MAG: hypothetical protein HY822_03395 [Acidobacteria bacterium]|nr:hypothetical protein [Acidobacteriota bacterium]